jgi:RNA polymerase sigma-70 factor (ECF subfamily)
LVARIQEGDRAAFEALFRIYYEDLCDFVESQVGASEVAEDLVQNVLLNVWRRRREWELKTTLRAYLFGAARNESIKHRKKRKVWRRWRQEEKTAPEDAPDEPSPVEDVEYREVKRAMRDGVSKLPERRREVYMLSRHHGLTYEEIAAVMGISSKTVDNQMVEALKFLREHLRSFLSADAR